MNFYMIRLKAHPEKYIGKQDPTCAIRTDGDIQSRMEDDGERGFEKELLEQRAFQLDAHWFVLEKRAKVWNDASTLKRFFGYAGYNEDKDKKTFDAYEVVIHRPGNDPQVISGTEFYRNWRNY